MKILGIESSCDECAASIVENGRTILSSAIFTQIYFHEHYQGVVPELASRKHAEWISLTVRTALAEAGVSARDVDGIAATSRPGLTGSLVVGYSFAKAFAWALEKPFVGINHMLAHLYAAHLDPASLPAAGKTMLHSGKKPESGECEDSLAAGLDTHRVHSAEQASDKAWSVPAPVYPYIGLLVSGGHSLICRVLDFDRIEVMGSTMDDAVGEAFDKVAKYYGFGYPGGLAIDRLAEKGDELAFGFPAPSLHKGEHRYDVSYSGLKTAAIHQLERYRRNNAPVTPENLAASFRKAAIDMLLSRLFRAVEDTGLRTIVAGGGVAANTYLRRILAGRKDLSVIFPPLPLCGDNGAMVAGIGYRMLLRGDRSMLNEGVQSRVPMYRNTPKRNDGP